MLSAIVAGITARTSARTPRVYGYWPGSPMTSLPADFRQSLWTSSASVVTFLSASVLGAALMSDGSVMTETGEPVSSLGDRLVSVNAYLGADSILDALRTGADLFLLDEPTEGLAPVIVQRIGEIIRQLKERGYTILLVEQNFHFAATVADRHYVMEDGRVVDTLAAADVARNIGKLQTYLGV